MFMLKKTTYFFLFSLAFLFTSPAFAAEVSFVSEKHTFAQNEEFLVSVYLNTEGESINAFEGKLFFPSDFLEKKEIRDGNSLINFWVERPDLKPSVNGEKREAISFSGITPGGFLGTKGFLFSVVFRAKKSGEGTIGTDNLRFLRNDGTGTPAKVKALPFSFSISGKTVPEGTVFEAIKDSEPPESFTPLISKDQNLFDGKFFLVFATQDKGSGLDYYEVKEEGSESFSRAESPYLLKNQRLDAKILVKAIDKAGNERVAEVPAQNLASWKQIAILLFLMALAIFVFRKKIWKKNISN